MDHKIVNYFPNELLNVGALISNTLSAGAYTIEYASKTQTPKRWQGSEDEIIQLIELEESLVNYTYLDLGEAEVEVCLIKPGQSEFSMISFIGGNESVLSELNEDFINSLQSFACMKKIEKSWLEIYKSESCPESLKRVIANA